MKQKMIYIHAKSSGFQAGNTALISINDIPVKMNKNESGHFRGLHIVVINSLDGKVEMTKVFDTYKSSEGFNKYLTHDIPDGYIIIAACSDECISNLSYDFK